MNNWDDVHLGRADAENLASRLILAWDLPPCAIVWEQPLDEHAYITWPEVAFIPNIAFRGSGCTLETLAHELAHLVEGPDVPTHGIDFNFLKELVAYQLRDYLRGSDNFQAASK